MSHNHYLIVIDSAPIEEGLQDYFSTLNIALIQQSVLRPLQMQEHLPMALLINWDLLEDDPMYIQHLYSTYPVPLLIISENEHEESKIIALELGADDFLIKPISANELHIRIKAIHKRITPEKRKKTQRKESIHFANWIVYPASRQVFNKQNKELHLTNGEYNLLLVFLKHPQIQLKRELLLPRRHSSRSNQFDRHVDIQISRLRNKIEDDTKNPTLIQTIRNYGYLFNATVTNIK